MQYTVRGDWCAMAYVKTYHHKFFFITILQRRFIRCNKTECSSCMF